MTSLFYAQISPDCAQAIPICSNTPVNSGTVGFGIDDFNGASSSGCLEKVLNEIESNSAWYRFKTGASGQLGFNIGFDAGEDWDFALYKTNDCGALGEPVRCNFYDNQDHNLFIGVGGDPTGDEGNIQYEPWLQVEPGEDYYLLINNFSNSNSGFSIQFSGNIFVTNPYDALDCSIISNLLGPPVAACEYDLVTLDANTPNALDYTWYSDTGAGFQEIVGENSPTLNVTATATYRVVVARAIGNIISDVQIGFSNMPVAHAVSDDAFCTGMTAYDLTLKDQEVLAGQDSSSFVVGYHASFTEAVLGINALPKQFMVPSGAFTVYVRVASVENPKCFDVSQQFQLINLATPELDFPTEAFICNDSAGIAIGSSTAEPNYAYFWDNGATEPHIFVTQPGKYTLTVTHTQEGFSCSNSKSVDVILSALPQITDVDISDLQSNNTAAIKIDIEGEWLYQLDDAEPVPNPLFTNVLPGNYKISVIDPRGCGMVSEDIVVVGFFKFFTPNGDGNNDVWSIEGIDRLNNAQVEIYDRYGKLLRQIKANDPGWNGTYNGGDMPESDYWFILTYENSDGQTVVAKYINNHFALKR